MPKKKYDFLKLDLLISLSIHILILSIIIILIITIVAWIAPEPPIPDYWSDEAALTYNKCCNGSYCTDTYYDPKIDKCVLVLCEHQMLSMNKFKCYYEPTG